MILENISMLLLLLVICLYFKYESNSIFQEWNLMLNMFNVNYTLEIVESNIIPKYILKVILNTVLIPIDTFPDWFDTNNGI